MTIEELQEEVIEEFSAFDDWMDKYQMIIDLGNGQAPMDPAYKTQDNLIDGCQSRVWLHAEFKDGLIHFEADSDAIITKGLIALPLMPSDLHNICLLPAVTDCCLC